MRTIIEVAYATYSALILADVHIPHSGLLEKVSLKNYLVSVIITVPELPTVGLTNTRDSWQRGVVPPNFSRHQ